MSGAGAAATFLTDFIALIAFMATFGMVKMEWTTIDFASLNRNGHGGMRIFVCAWCGMEIVPMPSDMKKDSRRKKNIYIYIYIYMCVCVCVCMRVHRMYVHPRT